MCLLNEIGPTVTFQTLRPANAGGFQTSLKGPMIHTFKKLKRFFTYNLPSWYQRPRAYWKDFYQWHLGQVPEEIESHHKKIKNPARWNAVFVVHGMGMQRWTETAVELRSGFEDAIEAIFKGQEPDAGYPDPRKIPAPFIHEGFWADYDDLEASLPHESERLDEHQQKFFSALWKKRTQSVFGTFWWFFRQQLSLLKLWRIRFTSWLLYIPLQVVSLVFFIIAIIRFRKVVSQVLADVRLYVDPKGVIERSIVQRIDQRVGSSFLQMIGLDWDFRPLPEEAKIQNDFKPIEFEQVTWIAHSLGTAVSYNVISDLFAKAKQIDKRGDPEQKAGVTRFRRSFRRFITLGSPLDKIAFLFGDMALRPWRREDRLSFWDHSDVARFEKADSYDWWVNFYHVLDPVSGSLTNPLICCDKPPHNLHMKFWKWPGFAHSAYWRDRKTLRYILSRVYGKDYLRDREYKPYPGWMLTLFAVAAYFIWAGILFGIVYVIFNFSEVRDFLFAFATGNP